MRNSRDNTLPGLPGTSDGNGRERLGLDCDGVLANFAVYILARLNRQLGTSFRVRDWRPFLPEDELGKTVEALVWQMMGEQTLWAGLPPYPGTSKRMAALRERYDIYIVSAIPAEFAEVRSEWLNRHNIPHERLVTVPEAEAKVAVAEELGLCAFVEDLASTAEQMAAAGIDSYLIRRPWNAGLPVNHGVRRGDWSRVLAGLLARPRPIDSSVPTGLPCRSRPGRE